MTNVQQENPAQAIEETVKVEIKEAVWLLCDLKSKEQATGTKLNEAVQKLETRISGKVQLPLRYSGFEHLTVDEFNETSAQAGG